MSTGQAAGKPTYAGLFAIALATLMYEILLTRIFSVTMWYHYSFMAISIAMFGMTAGAILVYLLPGRFTPGGEKRNLSLASLFFALSTAACFLIHIKIPFAVEGDSPRWLWLVMTYVVVAIPFVFAGIAVCVALTRFPSQVSGLYAADLAGAGLGCVLLIGVLDLTDGPSAMFVVGAAGALGAALFASDGSMKWLRRGSVIACFALASFAAVNTVMVSKGKPLVRLTWVKGRVEPPASYEKWNSFSRIRVWGSARRMERPFGWGLSPEYPSHLRTRQLHMNIDAGAYTPIPAFDGNLATLEYLKYDITNVAHYIRPKSHVLVIGAGGGRDVLSALAFEQSKVTALEINEDIVETVNRKFGRFTGHLEAHPKVEFVVDEARSYVARRPDTYGIIQVSLIDTWAATSAGAFVLAENSLYTLEAWRLFLERLDPGGVLTFSRWYSRDRPGEIYRLISLAAASLEELGVHEPGAHIVVLRNLWMGRMRNVEHGVGTILVSPDPFTEDDLDTIERIARDLKFFIVLSPSYALDSDFAELVGENRSDFIRDFPIDISAPTDDRPFFFNMLRMKDVFRTDLAEGAVIRFNLKAVAVLGYLLAIVLGLTALFIILPLALTRRRGLLEGTPPLFVFFSAIGSGFMFVEISQMQRLIVFLGHPTYGLSVVLFALLLSSGLGSLTTRTSARGVIRIGAVARLLLLLCMLALFGLLTPAAIEAFRSAGTPNRVAVATAMLFPLGLFMGMAFPLGLRLANDKSPAVTPWLWGLNGATSVCAAVIAVAIALTLGISAAFWAGFACYVVALLSFLWVSRTRL